MKILVTGSKGFIGRNLIATLNLIATGAKKNSPLHGDVPTILPYDKDDDPATLIEYCKEADFLFHLAGINQEEHDEQFHEINYSFAKYVLDTLKQVNNTCPVLLSSSISAITDTAYGLSKKEAEELFFEYGRETGANIYIYRFPNIFGKWSRPFYNSIIATMCYEIARGNSIDAIYDNSEKEFVYIDDVVDEILHCIDDIPHIDENGFCYVPERTFITLSHLSSLIYSFKETRLLGELPELNDPFIKKLYATYLSYIPEEDFLYELKDEYKKYGIINELFKGKIYGRFSLLRISGNSNSNAHFHQTKSEKFILIKGNVNVYLRKVYDKKIIKINLREDRHNILDIIPGYGHYIQNLNAEEAIILVYATEPYDPYNPDTYDMNI